MSAATLLVVILVPVTRSFLRVRWQTIAVRAIGSGICAIGLMVLALQYAGD